MVKSQDDRTIGAVGAVDVECYICREEIPGDETDWGFTWGSDGVFPDGASAMYCCKNCRDFWIDP